MTFALSGPVKGTFDPAINDASGGFNLMSQASLNYEPAANILSPRPYVFRAFGQFNGDDAENAANAVFRLGTPSGIVIGGQSLVLFPANQSRRLILKTWARRAGATDTGFTEKHIVIVGAATPGVRQDTTGAISASLATPVAIEQVAAGAVYVLPYATAEVGGVFINLRNVAAAAIQTAVNVAAGIRFCCELIVDPLVVLPAPV